MDVDENADTAPLALRAGERVYVENRIDRLELRLDEREKAMHQARADFYGTRMLPLEARSEQSNGRSLQALTLSIVAIAAAFIVLVLVVLLHALR